MVPSGAIKRRLCNAKHDRLRLETGVPRLTVLYAALTSPIRQMTSNAGKLWYRRPCAPRISGLGSAKQKPIAEHSHALAKRPALFMMYVSLRCALRAALISINLEQQANAS